MVKHDDPTFFLYGVGHNPDQLCLGDLVLGNYANPTNVPHYIHGRLSDGEFQEWACASDINGCFTSKNGLRWGITTDIFELASIRIGTSNANQNLVVAKAGRRVMLKDPEKFFNNRLLPEEAVRDQLRLWLTVARTGYMTRKVAFKKPKLWLLTGLYELEDVKAFVINEKSPSVSAELGSAAMAALAGVPLGGSIVLESGDTITAEFEMKGPNIWAAQYRLLDANYVRVGEEYEKMPNYFRLHRDVISKGHVRETREQDSPNAVEVTITDTPCSPNLEQHEVDEAYWQEFATAIEKLERYL